MFWPKFTIGVCLLAVVTVSVQASSWDNTLLVNTESFHIIDDGAVGSDIYITFGDIANESLFWNDADDRFEFTDDLHMQQNLTVSGGVVVDGAATLGSTLTIGGLTYNFPTAHGNAGDILMNDGSGNLRWDAGATGTTLKPYIATVCNKHVSSNTTGNVGEIHGGNFDTYTNFSFDAPITLTSVSIRTHEVADITYDVGNIPGSTYVSAHNFGNQHFGTGELVVDGTPITVIPGVSAAWQNISANITTGPGSISSTAGVTGWNKGASFGLAPAGTSFTLDFTAPVDTGIGMYGVDVIDPNQNYTTIDYAIYIHSNKNVYVYENGKYKWYLGTYVAGDTFQVIRTCSTISYHKNNGAALYISDVPSYDAMKFDSSLYRDGQISGITLEY